jgi:hypothetical protein
MIGPVGYGLNFGGIDSRKMPRQLVPDEYANALMHANRG